MRFEGTVSIQAARTLAWEKLIDQHTFARIAPGVHEMKTIVPDERFQIHFGLPFGAQPTILSAEVIMEERVDKEHLLWTTAVPLGTETILAYGDMQLSGTDRCELLFSAEVTHPPRAIPSPILHSIISNAIRTFFTNLKAELESEAWKVKSGE